jgi:succinate dehydrogenase / fumarate reductase, cytochrome b subunit
MAQAKLMTTKPQRPRPLSPHLQIYSPLVNMMMSIIHRITGAALYFGTLLLAWWLIAAAAGPDQFAIAKAFLGSPLGLFILLGYTWAFMHHLLGGVRHLIWDTGRGFALSAVDALCWLTLVLSLALTAAIWVGAWYLKGAL